MKKLVLLLPALLAFGPAHAERWHGGWHGGGWHGYGHAYGGWHGGWRGGWDDDPFWFGAGLLGGMMLAQPPVYYYPSPIYVAPPVYTAPPVVIQPQVIYSMPGAVTYGPITYYNGYGPNTDR